MGRCPFCVDIKIELTDNISNILLGVYGMRKYLFLSMALLMAALVLVACGSNEESNKEEVTANNESNSESNSEENVTNNEDNADDTENDNDNNEKEIEEKDNEKLRELDQEELELWNETDIPYLLEKHDIIESIEWTETEVAIELKESKVTGIVEDNLYDSTNQIGKDIQEIVDWNYDVKEIPVTFYVNDEVVSKQNEHGIWVNFKMSNWKE